MSEFRRTTERFQLLIFDWDGTIADSLQHIVRSIRFAIDKLGFPYRDDVMIRGIIGLGLKEALECLYPGASARQRKSMEGHYREYYQSAEDDGISLFPHVKETIKLLHANGHDLAIATGKSRRGLNKALADSGMLELFHYSRCADETLSKPNPQMLEDIMKIFSMAPDKVLMIGDSEHDLQMAANAGVASAAVAYGAQDCEYLSKFRPVACFNNLQELPGWLTENPC